MAKKNRRWIQRAIRYPGSLKKWAREHGFITKRGTINLREAEAYARKHGLTHRIRQINLVKNLKSFH
ncbi:MAG: hypothetical protein ACP5L4_06350 [Thermoplasmata archaeon]